MGKRYYCDYCDKSFADLPKNRQNHMKGVVHRQLKSEHYDYFKDAATKLREDLGKNPCRKFLNEGSCNFGSLCMYSHITPDLRSKLQVQAEKESEKKSNGKSTAPVKVSSDEEIQDWLRVCKQRLSEDGADSVGKSANLPADRDVFPTYELPDCLKGRGSLPPSLLPPRHGDLQSVQVDGWG